MKMMAIFISLLLGSGLLAGCSNIGAVNGVPVKRVAGDGGNTGFCARNPMTCMLGAAAIVGGTAVIVHNSKGNNAVTPAPSGIR
ncbi:MAG: hypothetical protein L3J67_08730 [Hyphomicrobiaceae bacterium]|nr:hypothetical protein [Hyphomicrobiaceae bacterium]